MVNMYITWSKELSYFFWQSISIFENLCLHFSLSLYFILLFCCDLCTALSCHGHGQRNFKKATSCVSCLLSGEAALWPKKAQLDSHPALSERATLLQDPVYWRCQAGDWHSSTPALLLAHGLLIILSASGSLTLISDLELDRCRGKGARCQAESHGGCSGAWQGRGCFLVGRCSWVFTRLWREGKGSKGEVPCVLAWCLWSGRARPCSFLLWAPLPYRISV